MKKYIRELTAFLLAAVLFFTVSWQLGQLLMPIRTVYGSDWEAFLEEEPEFEFVYKMNREQKGQVMN